MGALVAMSIFGIVIMSGINLTGNYRRSNSTVRYGERLGLIRDNLIAMLTYENFFNYSVDGLPAGTYDCLKRTNPNTDCAADAAANPTGVLMDVRAPDNTTYYASRTATAGFAFQIASPTTPTTFSEVCSSYNSASHNPRCPIRVNVYVKILCPASGECKYPKLEFRGEFVSNATNAASLYLARYNFKFIKSHSRAFEIFHVIKGATSSTGGGTSVTNGWQYVGFTPSFSLLDYGSNVLARYPAAGTFNYIQIAAGIYDCEFSAAGYQVGKHTVQLMEMDSTALAAGTSLRTLIWGDSSYADPNREMMTRSEGRGTLTLNTDTWVGVRMYTEQISPSNASYSLGRPTTWKNNSYAFLRCMKL